MIRLRRGTVVGVVAERAGAIELTVVVEGTPATALAYPELVGPVGAGGAVVTAGQAFGGALEAVSVCSGGMAARYAVGADVVIVGDGPGNTGTGTTWGSSDVASAMALNAIGALGGRPVAALRVSFADPRGRHRAVSHHSLTALRTVALVPVHVAVPTMEDPGRRAAVWDALRAAKLEERHQLVAVT